MSISSKAAVIFALFALGVQLAPVRAQFVSQNADLALLIDFDKVRSAQKALAGTTYDGQYKSGAALCNDFPIAVTLSSLDITGRSSTSFITAGTGSALNGILSGSIHLGNNCLTRTDPKIRCDTTAPLVGLPNGEARFQARCDLAVGLFHFYSFPTISLPFPMALYDVYTINLVDPPATSQSSLTLQFARKNGGLWETIPGAGAKTKIIKSYTNSLFAKIPSATPRPDAFEQRVDAGNILVYRSRVVPPVDFSKHPTTDEAWNEATLKPNVSAMGSKSLSRLSIASSLLAPSAASPDHEGRGLLGSLFPLRVKGEHTTNTGRRVALDMVFRDLTVTFGNAAGAPLIDAKLGLDVLEIIDVSTGMAAQLQNATSNVDIDVPKFDVPSKQIATRLKSLSTKLQILVAGASEDVQIDDGVRSALSLAAPALARGDTTLEFSLPECIKVEDSHISAPSACSSFGNATVGYLKARSLPRNALTIDWSAATVAIVNGRLDLDIPVR